MGDSDYQLRWPRIGAVVAVGLLIAFLVWLLVIKDDDDNGSSNATAAPAATSESDLASLADELGHPIYWAGPQSSAQLELEQSGGDVFLRYLTGDANVGTPQQDYLTVGTYPFPNAFDTLKDLSKDEGSLTNETPDGGFVLTNQGNPTSVYIAYPDQDLQIEVYDPDPERAFDIATSGDITPVE
jgi:hypothetical protein